MLTEPSKIDSVKSKLEQKHQGDEEQLDVVFYPGDRLLVEAPAGYGKTHTMVSRIAYLISTGKIPYPKRLLALTFSVNAAYKIKKDVKKYVPELISGLDKQINISEKIFVSNYHGFCRSVLGKYGRLIHPALPNIDELQPFDDGKENNIKKVAEGISNECLEIVTTFNQAVKNVRADQLKQNIGKYNSVVTKEFLERKVIPYNAILTLTIQLFSNFEEVLKFYHNYYTSILVDEFQDTNLLSYWLLWLLITKDKTNVMLLGDPLQRIYGFIGAVPNLLDFARNRLNLACITLKKNHRFASNHDMLCLDTIIRQNAVAPFTNPKQLTSKISLSHFDNQEQEALGTLIKAVEILEEHPSSKVAILVRQRSPNVDAIIDTFKKYEQPFFYGLFTDEDGKYVNFNKKCLEEFNKLTEEKKLSRIICKQHINKMRELFSRDDYPTVQAFLELLEVFWEQFFLDYGSLSDEERLSLIQDTFAHNALKQYMEFLDTQIIISTVHAAKGLEWDYVILPDMERGQFPSWRGLCEFCKDQTCYNPAVSFLEKLFLEELSVFYVAVTRARKQVYFSASAEQLTSRGSIQSKLSCFLKFPGLVRVLPSA